VIEQSPHGIQQIRSEQEQPAVERFRRPVSGRTIRVDIAEPLGPLPIGPG